MQRRITLERLHAEERGRANQLLLQQFESQTKSESEEETATSTETKTQSQSEPTEENKEAKIEAFLDEIEGETLGQMLHYLSSELESSEADIQPQSEIIKRKKQSEQIDHVFTEITKVTQTAVDRYVDGILLNTIYKKAGQEAGKELDEKIAADNSALRRASDTDMIKDAPSPDIEGGSKMSLEIRKRIKEFQKKHLLAAHDALWGVLGDMKARGEVRFFIEKTVFSILGVPALYAVG